MNAREPPHARGRGLLNSHFRASSKNQEMSEKIREKRSVISHTKRWSEQPDLKQSNLIELGFGLVPEVGLEPT